LQLFAGDNRRDTPHCVILGVVQAGISERGPSESLAGFRTHRRGRLAISCVTTAKVVIMRAAYYGEQGLARDVLCLGELPTPEPGPGEVRVRLRASGVNCGGFGGGEVAPLTIPHSDGAGDIDAVGPGVSNRIGERVWVWNGRWKRPHGTAAEYIVLPSVQAVHLPPNVSYAEGACLGIPALTAVQAVRLANIGPCSKVLITGGAGPVTSYAIQLAKLYDAIVISTVSSDIKAAHAEQAGADAIINYRNEDVGGRVKALTNGRGVDAVIDVDLSGNAGLYPAILRPHAIVVACGMSASEAMLPALWMMQNSITLRLFLVHDMNEAERAAGIAELGQWLKEGCLGHTIGRRLPLERIAEAHEVVERGEVIGNVVLDIS
jgi:NADPH:quinone reductase